MSFKTLLSLLFIALTATTQAQATTTKTPVKVVDNFNIELYEGTWFEVARTENWFQKSCTKNTLADYSKNSDGTIRVENTCTTANGTTKQAIGTAKVEGPAKLKVSFAPKITRFIDATWGDYWVIDIDKNYTLAAVSDPKRENLWILSRSPRPAQAAYEALLSRLEKNGFDTKTLINTKQESAD
jgi:apolipoprotein D and lipocalin family protein